MRKIVFLLFWIFLIVFMTGSAFSQEYQVDEFTTALWHMNEGSGNTIFDEAQGDNNGIIDGATWTTEGRFGNALSFDGINDKVGIANPTNMPLSSAITIEAWIKRASNQDGTIISKNGPYNIRVINNKLYGGVYTDGWTEFFGNTELETGIWYHAAMTYDGEMIKFYLNGKEDGSMPKNGLMPSVSQGLHIGWGDPGQNQYFHGIIDEVRISNIARTEFNVGICQGDIHEDGFVDITDLFVLFALWGTDDPLADLNNDGIVGINDLFIMFANWGSCNEPLESQQLTPEAEELVRKHFENNVPKEVEAILSEEIPKEPRKFGVDILSVS